MSSGEDRRGYGSILELFGLQIFKGTNGNSRPNPKKQKLFGAPPADMGPIPVPAPLPHLATPKEFPPVSEGPALQFDLPPECRRDPYEEN